MKKQNDNNLHQITKICYKNIEEHWEPTQPELEKKIIKKKLPVINILLSKEPLSIDELGYQPPGAEHIEFNKDNFKFTKNTTETKNSDILKDNGNVAKNQKGKNQHKGNNKKKNFKSNQQGNKRKNNNKQNSPNKKAKFNKTTT